MLAHREEDIMIDEALAGIVLFQHRDMWSEAKPAGFDGKLEHSLKRREFAVDARVRCTLALPAPDVFLDPVGRDVDSAVQCEVASEVPGRELYRAQRPELVDLVVRDERIRHVFKAEALLAGADEFAAGDFPDAFLQNLSRGT